MAANCLQVVDPFSTLIQTILLNTPTISGSDRTSVRLLVASSSSAPGENVFLCFGLIDTGHCSAPTNNNNYEHSRLGFGCSDGFSDTTVKPFHDDILLLTLEHYRNKINVFFFRFLL